MNTNLSLQIQRLKSDFEKEVNKLKTDHKEEIASIQQELAEHAKRQEHQEEIIKELKACNISMQQEKIKLEALSLQKQIIISGPKVPDGTKDEDTSQIARSVIKDVLHLGGMESRVVKASRLGAAPSGGRDKRHILVHCADLVAEREILNASITVKADGIFVSEFLPQSVNNLLYKLRKIKRDSGEIAVLHTKDRQIVVKKTKTGKKYHILTQSDLEKFLGEAGLADHL